MFTIVYVRGARFRITDVILKKSLLNAYLHLRLPDALKYKKNRSAAIFYY